jgi:hypothetical protein
LYWLNAICLACFQIPTEWVTCFLLTCPLLAIATSKEREAVSCFVGLNNTKRYIYRSSDFILFGNIYFAGNKKPAQGGFGGVFMRYLS